MRESLNSNTLFNMLAMIRAESMRPILVVEGDDDLFLIKPHVHERTHLIKGTGGKLAVLMSARLADTNRLSGVLFLIDSDFDSVLGENRPYPAAVASSTHHDVIMDTLLVNRPILIRVIEAHCRHASRRIKTDVNFAALLEDALELAARIAHLRIVNQRDELGLILRDFPFGLMKAISPEPVEIARLALTRSKSSVTLADLAQKLEESIARSDYESVHIIGDHDLFRALSRVLSLNGITGIGADQIWTSTLAAIQCEHLMKTPWFLAINTWSATQEEPGFKCPCAA